MSDHKGDYKLHNEDVSELKYIPDENSSKETNVDYKVKVQTDKFYKLSDSGRELLYEEDISTLKHEDVLNIIIILDSSKRYFSEKLFFDSFSQFSYTTDGIKKKLNDAVADGVITFKNFSDLTSEEYGSLNYRDLLYYRDLRSFGF